MILGFLRDKARFDCLIGMFLMCFHLQLDRRTSFQEETADPFGELLHSLLRVTAFAQYEHVTLHEAFSFSRALTAYTTDDARILIPTVYDNVVKVYYWVHSDSDCTLNS